MGQLVETGGHGSSIWHLDFNTLSTQFGMFA